MMKVWLWLIIGCLVGISPQTTKAQDDNVQAQIRRIVTIIPAESNFEDVKQLLGEPLDKSPDFYKFPDFNVMISYASGLPCDAACSEKGRDIGWMVPRDTVITVAIFVKVAFHQNDLEKLDIDLSTFKKGKADHIGSVSYSNEEDGIEIEMNGKQVEGISLFPAKKYFHLMCPETSVKPVCSR